MCNGLENGSRGGRVRVEEAVITRLTGRHRCRWTGAGTPGKTAASDYDPHEAKDGDIQPWHMAVMAILLAETAKETELDLLRVIQVLLVHDIVEIDAGDTFCYDDGRQAQRLREETAAFSGGSTASPRPRHHSVASARL